MMKRIIGLLMMVGLMVVNYHPISFGTVLHWLTSRMVVIRFPYNEYWVTRTKKPLQSM